MSPYNEGGPHTLVLKNPNTTQILGSRRPSSSRNRQVIDVITDTHVYPSDFKEPRDFVAVSKPVFYASLSKPLHEMWSSTCGGYQRTS